MAPPKHVNIAILGTGGVGSHVLSQLSWISTHHPSTHFNLIYLATIDGALYNDNYKPIDIETALNRLQTPGAKRSLLTIQTLATYLANAPYRAILADITSCDTIAQSYPLFLERGISIVTPNKKAFSGSYELWRDIFDAARCGGALIGHESSVGAGMPIISTMRDFGITGDRVMRVEGVVSGALSFLFNEFAPLATSPAVSGSAGGSAGGRWSEIVKKARERGYTQPDPRDDLNGLDVARDVTILARLAGLPIEQGSFPVQSLVPKELEGIGSAEEFLARLPEFDERMDEERERAVNAGRVLRHVGIVDIVNRRAEVGLKWFEPDDPIARLQGRDNVIRFYTKRYGDDPLIISGAGAGGSVTAMGVTGDMLRILHQLG
ncbi:hypothetical protein ASPVEDRAFT_57097 [Aspergillus versicolor CBS 583.65]|uniref:Homoserine dehydrogenase n=1 Tax=Aspergillus versicolor CBS 583.65 TaxID=1036611 RepID=A0A1L9Q277_ASPVE|nr:uncharacterized protein ASPVEDRAFT_57097 [Aspergillus versicolor CBS 583.65]OJJ07848.1 hypothetical protein ASPVEDRAFT_57097 [Aspergillus versicolor CBS 583.65]